MNNGRDCEHGRRVGNCDSCDLAQAENTIARLLAGKWDGNELALISSTQVVADIRADAGRSGFIAGAEMWSDYGVKSRYKDDYLVDIEADAERYSAKVRKGEQGTWLKDSNVNGGKRQGGE